MTEIKNQRAEGDWNEVENIRIASKITHRPPQREQEESNENGCRFVGSNVFDKGRTFFFMIGMGLGFALALAWITMIAH